MEYNHGWNHSITSNRLQNIMRSFSHTYFFVLLRCTQNHVAELELGRVHVLSPHKLILPTQMTNPMNRTLLSRMSIDSYHNKF